MTRKIHIFDTTLRDGEQSPGASMNTEEKLVIAQQLIRMGVDVIEAGFPISSPGDFRSVQEIGRLAGDDCVVCGLTRAVEKDIDRAAEALKCAKRPRIHTGIGVSPSHLRDKLRITEDECVERAIHCVEYAKKYVEDVEFYAEDAGRADQAFLERVIQAVVKAGATVVNIPDTTGYQLPEDFGRRIKGLCDNVIGIEDVIISVHTHNDLGMATALALQGVKNGARQIECTINGLGERAGNASLDEIVMGLRTRRDIYGLKDNLNIRELYRLSRLAAGLSGMEIPPNKAVVGANAFVHQSGIHQHGVLRERATYEIMKPEELGIPQGGVVLGKLSGRHALREHAQELGFELTERELDRAFEKFKELADRKKDITERDVMAICREQMHGSHGMYRIHSFQIFSGNRMTATATVSLQRGADVITRADCGDGPVEACFHAVDQITGFKCKLESYQLRAVTEGEDALGEVTVRVSNEGITMLGKGVYTDIIAASCLAYLNAANRVIEARQEREKAHQ